MTHRATQHGTRSGWRGLWTLCAAWLLCFLAGCSFLSLYRYADWIILWQADQYLDLTSDQRRDLSQRLTQIQPVSATPPGFVQDGGFHVQEGGGMARVGRPGMTEAQKDEVWRRWRTEESLSDVGRAVGRFPASIFWLSRLHGGITPPARHRAVRALTLAEREEISRGLAAGASLRQIAQALQRAPSTISREVLRNTMSQSYRATRAEECAWARARRPKLCRLALNRKLRYYSEQQARTRLVSRADRRLAQTEVSE